MAHTLTAIIPKIITRALPVLRERCMMPQLVNKDYRTAAKKYGSTIDIEIPSAVAVAAVTPAAVPTVGSDRTPATVQIALDQWYKNDPIFLDDQDLLEVDRSENFLPPTIAEAIRALANKVNQQIWSWYYKTGQYFMNSTNSFSSVADAIQARKLLNQGLAPKSDRHAVLDWTTEAYMLTLAAFSDFEKTGEKNIKIEGDIGRKFGLNWYSDDHVPALDFTAEETGATTVNGVHAAGATTLSIAKAAGTNMSVVQGDILTIAGDDAGRGYSVQANATITAATNSDVTISPGLRAATAGSEVVDFPMEALGSSYQCLAFHRDAIAFANRPLVTSSVDGELGNKLMTLTDPLSGLTLRLEVSRQYKQTAWEFDILWGSNMIRPDNVMRIIGY